MARKRLTQIFPFLIPIRQKQRTFCFYLAMAMDHHIYAHSRDARPLPHLLHHAQFPLINYESGYDLVYQQNKVHNLKLVAQTMDGLLIRPGETFSFWQQARWADRKTPYREGLCLVDGKITGKLGGGVCQISDLCYWLFLHTPLTVVERHPHAVKDFPTNNIPAGADATIHEGWLDLKVKNETNATYQLRFSFDEDIHGDIFCDQEPLYRYTVDSRDLTYLKKGAALYEQVAVFQKQEDAKTGAIINERLLYKDCCKIGFIPPPGSRLLTLYE